MISVQTQDFDIGALYQQLNNDQLNPHGYGAIVTFVGKVRDFNQQQHVAAMSLEHYPGMTEKSLAAIIQQAKSRWPIGEPIIIHRVGQLQPGDQIVYIGVTSAHRKAAFEACEFLIDYLKIKAPFWKKEQTDQGLVWVDARETDQAAATRWQPEHEQ
ncbi:MAG: molybdopterin synthase catalytic subunit MoaE [Gammaproteobacteria bacterium]|nr:molybdopterin synthase catalytic subunit MoaE [Gammaproteobacteria bacterium]